MINACLPALGLRTNRTEGRYCMSKLIEVGCGNRDIDLVKNDVYFRLSVSALFIVSRPVHYIVLQICNGIGATKIPRP